MTHPNKKSIKNKLALDIFTKEVSELNHLENDFIDFQCRQYSNYKKRAAAKLREAENKKKLTSHEYEMIEYLFFQRVYIWDVLNGIDNGVKVARDLGLTIFSAGFFKPHIYKLYIQRKKQISSKTDHVIENLDKPWFFLFYKMAQAGDLQKWLGKDYVFDPYYGFKRK